MRGEPTVILAEGFSGDTHYGKTMRGVLRYRPDDVRAILDSEAAGGVIEGVPVVGSVADAAALGAPGGPRRGRDARWALSRELADDPP